MKRVLKKISGIVLATVLAIGIATDSVSSATASQEMQIATMETLFAPESIRLDNNGDSARVNIETYFDLDGSVWLALFNVIYNPSVIEISDFRCEGFLQNSIAISPVPLGSNTLMGCVKQPGEVVDINSPLVASFAVTRVGPGEAIMAFGSEDALGTQFHSYARGRLTPGLTNVLTILQDETIPTRDLARGSQIYLEGQGPRFLYFNDNTEWSLVGGVLSVQGTANFPNETVGVLIGGQITKIVQTSAGGLDVYVSPLNGEYHLVAFPKIPYGTPIQLR